MSCLNNASEEDKKDSIAVLSPSIDVANNDKLNAEKKIEYYFDVTGSMAGFDEAGDSLYKHTLTLFFDEELNILDKDSDYYWFGESLPDFMIGINKFADKLQAKDVMINYKSKGKSIYTQSIQKSVMDSNGSDNVKMPKFSDDNEMNQPFNLLTKHIQSKWNNSDRSLFVITTDMQEQGGDYSCFQEIFKYANQYGKSFAFFLITSDYKGEIYNIYPGEVYTYYTPDVYFHDIENKNNNDYDTTIGTYDPTAALYAKNGGNIRVKYSGKKLFSILIFGEKEDIQNYCRLFDKKISELNKESTKNPIGSEIFLYDTGVNIGNDNMFHLENYNPSIRFNKRKPEEYENDFNQNPFFSIGVGSANNYLKSAANAFNSYYPIDDNSALTKQISEIEQRKYYVIDTVYHFSRYVFAVPINYSEIGLKSDNFLKSYNLKEISAEDKKNEIAAALKELSLEKVEKNMIAPSSIKIIPAKEIEKNLISLTHDTHIKHVENQDYFYFSVQLSNEDFKKYKQECAYCLTIEFGNKYEELTKSTLKSLIDKYNADYPTEIVQDAIDRTNIMRTMSLKKIYSYISDTYKESLGSSFEIKLYFMNKKS